ncbi:MAG TPA: DUF1330 domain-containing protein [Burkholderiales bacterium]
MPGRATRKQVISSLTCARVLIEFPSLEQARKGYDSTECAPLLKLRLESTRGNAVFIEGRA